MNLLSKRLMTRALVLSTGIALLLSGAPAQAGELSFSDPAGDATTFVVENAPKASDPELDILSVKLTTDADSLSGAVKFAALGTPQLATGATRTLSFTYEGAEYAFRFQAPSPPADNVAATGFFFRKGSTTIACARCSGKLDPKTSSLVFDAEFKSMSAGMKAEDASVKPIGPGSKISTLSADSFRTVGLAALDADTAAPAGEVELVL